jgi:hypothetical protein
MKQARPYWEIERAVRRRMLTERFAIFMGGVLVALAFFAVMLTISLAV